MTEIILASIILALIIVNVYLYSRMVDMTDRYMRAFMAKSLTDFTNNDLIKNEKPEVKKEEEFIPLATADESVFKKYLKQQENGGQDELPEV